MEKLLETAKIIKKKYIKELDVLLKNYTTKNEVFLKILNMDPDYDFFKSETFSYILDGNSKSEENFKTKLWEYYTINKCQLDQVFNENYKNFWEIKEEDEDCLIHQDYGVD